MRIPFNSLPPQSKIWIYQSDKAFTEAQILEIANLIEPFIEQWQRHGANLNASYIIKYNRFIIIAVDEHDEVSGCSVDASVHLIQKIEQKFGVNLTDKLKVAYKEGDTIALSTLADFKKQIALSNITPETIVFNNIVNTVATLKTDWEIPIKQSWLKKYF
ncbi:MAG: ABC transporter ATPase [Flavobacteriales bacterium CG_4_9_14_0_2_um_filter_35_242]|nr:MAG: ABC transporter ATPase [Flavobacteriales bacterium CG11_big_fil_rev_8_21_14_0_20_35_7]PIV16374.1 MAG: ABC transporter ATPase [Flavobacteriales bacterium CG03_land_8_20_14_0_80_35_15]PJA05981.1 MAG: ABC transporter ATPase [Flavobacteriales bacterium CG_4_10_14_0_2_um_filter_35_18]PJC60087.1 MAG: ABC transporter ATPase [Flavobacteriales bacterium CG_4_9_14_0_2_um_filter_35_242]